MQVLHVSVPERSKVHYFLPCVVQKITSYNSVISNFLGGLLFFFLTFEETKNYKIETSQKSFPLIYQTENTVLSKLSYLGPCVCTDYFG